MYQKYCDTYKTKKAYIESFGSKMERGVSRGKREGCLSDQDTCEGLGIWRGNPRPFNDRDESAACFYHTINPPKV